jgi:hypothetical protein
MAISRRSFLTGGAAASFLPAFLSAADSAQTPESPGADVIVKPTAGELYWSSLYKRATMGGGGPKTPPGWEDPKFAFFHEQKGLRWVEGNQKEELPNFDADAVATLELAGFRNGHPEEKGWEDIRYAQLHLSLQQLRGWDFVGPLAWASLATLVAGDVKRLPSIADLTPGGYSQTMPSAPQLNRVLLPEGAGHLSVNITTTPTTSWLHKILEGTLRAGKILTPLLGLPAISVAALNNVMDFYGKLEKADAINLKLNVPLKHVVVTQKGATHPDVPQDRVYLLSGDYVVVSKSHADLLESEMRNLRVQNGYMIRRADDPAKERLDKCVEKAVPEITYVTLHVDVRPASAFPLSQGSPPTTVSAAPKAGDSSAKNKPKPPH